MHARFVLRWLVGTLDALPLWNAGPGWPEVTVGADYAQPPADIERAYDWAILASLRYPWPDELAFAAAWRGAGWACGMEQLLAWACGQASEGPLTGLSVTGRPTLYQVALDVRRAMAGVRQAREADRPFVAARMEAMMETFLWLAGWNPIPPVDKNGHSAFEQCPERETLYDCQFLALPTVPAGARGTARSGRLRPMTADCTQASN